MSDLKMELAVSVEKVVHETLTRLANEVADKYSIFLEGVNFDWRREDPQRLGQPPTYELRKIQVSTVSREG